MAKKSLQENQESEHFLVPTNQEDVKDSKILKNWHRYAGMGFNASGIVTRVALELNISPEKVKDVAKKANLIEQSRQLQQDIKEEVFKNKIPLLKEIVGASLSSVRDYLAELSTDKERLLRMSVSEMKGLADVAKNLNELLRLELGQSTQNVQVVQYSFNEAKILLEDLKTIDPVFEYPELSDEK